MNESEARRLVLCYSDMILRISYTYLKSTADAEDICQNVFLKFLHAKKIFESQEQEKAWIIRTTINLCKDLLKSAYKRKFISMGSMIPGEQAVRSEAGGNILEEVMKLPEKYRISIYLFYYEGYSTREIGVLLNKSENVIASYLSRGRKKLRNMLTKTTAEE